MYRSLQLCGRLQWLPSASGFRLGVSQARLTICQARQMLSGLSSEAGGSSGSEQGGGGGGPSEEARRRARNLQVATGAACAFFGASYLLYRQLSLRAESESVSVTSVEPPTRKKKRVSFHDQRVIGYEDRIRAYSTPDKIFRYFATLRIQDRDGSVDIYMTPEDFLRSITPGWIQPKNLGLDQFRNLTLDRWIKERSLQAVHRDSVFSQLGNYGLISFSDYLFFLTLLATPARRFEIAFKMFDLNGDGEVDFGEFEQVRTVVLNSTAVGRRHKDHQKNVAGSVGDALAERFFGPSLKDRLTVEEFRQFHDSLQAEVLRLEFNRFSPEDGRITELDFGKLVLSYSEMNDQRRKKYLRRIRKAYGQNGQKPEGISFDEVQSFAKLVECISDVQIALSMFLAAGASITGSDLKDVAKAVAGVTLSDHLVEFVILMFDEDGDGSLSHREFTKVLMSRSDRGLEKSKDLGVVRLLTAMISCGSKTVKDQLGVKS